MLRIPIEIVPHGTGAPRRLARIDIANVSGPGRFSQDYAWRVVSADGTREHGYLLDIHPGSSVDLLAAVLAQRGQGGLPFDNHGRRRPPEGMPEDPSLAWRAGSDLFDRDRHGEEDADTDEGEDLDAPG